jgi:hypothetical protein
MRLWRTTKHENSQTRGKSFIFNKRSGYFHSRRVIYEKDYSYRRAIMGSTRMARRAGM